MLMASPCRADNAFLGRRRLVSHKNGGTRDDGGAQNYFQLYTAAGNSEDNRASGLIKRQTQSNRRNHQAEAQRTNSHGGRFPYGDDNYPSDRTDIDESTPEGPPRSRRRTRLKFTRERSWQRPNFQRGNFLSDKDEEERHSGRAKMNGYARTREHPRTYHDHHQRPPIGREIQGLQYIMSRDDLVKVMQRHPGELVHDMNDPRILEFLHKHQEVINVISADEYRKGSQQRLRKGSSERLRRVGTAFKARWDAANAGDHHLHPEDSHRPERAHARGDGPPGPGGAGRTRPRERNDEDRDKPFWKRPLPGFMWGLMGTGIAVGGSVPTMVQAHGYAAQARAQQQAANAATAGMIRNGSETPDGNSVVMANGTTVPIPRVNGTTKLPTKRDLSSQASGLFKRASG